MQSTPYGIPPFPYWGHFDDPNLLGLLRRTISTKISHLPNIVKVRLWASKRMVGGESWSDQSGHIQKVRLPMKNAIKPIWNTPFPYWGHFENPNLLGLLRRTIWTKVSYVPTIAKLGLWALKRMVGGESWSHQFGDIQKVRLRMCNKTHMK